MSELLVNPEGDFSLFGTAPVGRAESEYTIARLACLAERDSPVFGLREARVRPRPGGGGGEMEGAARGWGAEGFHEGVGGGGVELRVTHVECSGGLG